MESLKRSMKAALMTPLVSSLALTWGKAISQDIYFAVSSKRFVETEKQSLCMWTLSLCDNASDFVCTSLSAICTLRLQSYGRLHLKLTLKSRRASIWFWIMGMVLSSFSVFMVLITPSTLSRHREIRSRKGHRREQEEGKANSITI